MKNKFRGFSKVFSFTFFQHIKSKGYRNSTILIALLCLVIPAAVMVGIESKNEQAPEDYETGAEYTAETAQSGEYGDASMEQLDVSKIKKVFTVDLSDDGEADMGLLSDFAAQAYGAEFEVVNYGSDFDKASEDSRGADDVVLAVTEQTGRTYKIYTVLPNGSGLTEDDAAAFDELMTSYATVLETKGMEAVGAEEKGEDDFASSLTGITQMIFCFLGLMILYFFVLVYGQGVANSVVMEKSSKLVETCLVSVKPEAIVLGKLTAITLTGLVQLFSWLLSLAISFGVGTAWVKSINPDTDMLIIQVFDIMKAVSASLFSPLNCILAVLIIMSGMMLYCALAAIGGAMASKPEDLSSANILFTMVLIVSFLVSIYCGGMEGTAAPWLDWIPFTAVMVTPAKVLLGLLPLWKTVACFGITLICTVLMTYLAGRIYQALVLYKGNALTPVTILKKLRN